MQVTSETTKITKATIDAVWRRRAPDHRLIIRDRICRGLMLVVNATSMTWSYAYRPRGLDPATRRRWSNRSVTIGNPASHSIETARHEVNRLKAEIAAGGDPALSRKVLLADAQRRRGATLGRLFDDYAKVIVCRQKPRGGGRLSPTYVAEELAQIQMALAHMDAARFPVADLTPEHVRRLVATVEGETTARKRFGALSRFLDWAVDFGHIPFNPCAQVSRAMRPKPPQARSSFLTVPELARLWRAAEALREPVWRDLSRFLIVMPCRRNEAARMQWEHVKPEAAEWHQPGHLTKNGEPHRLYLPALALDLLGERRAVSDGKGLVFAAPKSGRPVTTFSDMKAELVKAMAGEPLPDWRWHDVRRSFASAVAEHGVAEPAGWNGCKLDGSTPAAGDASS
jgi:integrase